GAPGYGVRGDRDPENRVKAMQQFEPLRLLVERRFKLVPVEVNLDACICPDRKQLVLPAVVVEPGNERAHLGAFAPPNLQLPAPGPIQDGPGDLCFSRPVALGQGSEVSFFVPTTAVDSACDWLDRQLGTT